MSVNSELLPTVNKLEYTWLDAVYAAIQYTDIDAGVTGQYSWAAYNASCQVIEKLHRPDVSILLPMFRDPAHSPAMICNAMTIISSTTQRINPGQIPVVALHQPLYSLAKQIQWNWPSSMPLLWTV